MIVPRQLHSGHIFKDGRSVIPRPSLPPGQPGRFYEDFATRARGLFAGQTAPAPPIAHIYVKEVDPVERLPHELSVQCIYEDLLSSGSYPARLTELTTVSLRWQQFLISESLLWTEIHVKWTEPDVMATIATFLQLSGERSLSLTIWNPPHPGWENTRRLLLPYHRRINHLDIRSLGEIPSEEVYRWSTRCFEVASTSVGSLGGLPNLKRVTYDREFSVSQLGIDRIYIPPGGRVTSTFQITLHKSSYNHGDFDIQPVLDCDPTQLASPALITLDLDLSSGRTYKETESVMTTRMVDSSQLERVLAAEPRQFGLKQLIHLSASQLFSLSLKFGSLELIPEILALLPRLGRLNELALHMTLSGGFDLANLTPHVDSASGMRKLTLTVRPWSTPLHDAIESVLFPLMAAFTSRHPLVSSLSFNFFEGMIQPLEYYLIQWKYLESLSFITCLWAVVDNYIPITDPPLALPAVAELTVDDVASLQELELPNLFRLLITGAIINPEEIGFRFRQLRKLEIQTYVDVAFDSLAYPELCELRVAFHQPGNRLDVSSLSQLVSITIISQTLMNDQGNLLCLALLYHPEHCPRLQELHFDNYVEWDILYLMLESRNFGLDSIKKIREVTLPFIPPHLLPSLTLLLEGTPTKRPSNLELSLEETREVLFDPSIDGCFYCVKNMRAHCSQSISKGPWGSYTDILPNIHDPLSTSSLEIWEWITRRRLLEEKWRESCMEFDKGYARRKGCSRYRPGLGV